MTYRQTIGNYFFCSELQLPLLCVENSLYYFMIAAGKRSELQLLFAYDESSELRVKLPKFVSKVVFKELPLLLSNLLIQLKNEWVAKFDFIFFIEKQ